MNFKRAFRALWDIEPTDETGIPESEKLDISPEKPIRQQSRFIPHNVVDPIKELVESQYEN